MRMFSTLVGRVEERKIYTIDLEKIR